MGPPRFELESRRPERHRMDQATLRAHEIDGYCCGANNIAVIKICDDENMSIIDGVIWKVKSERWKMKS